MSRKHYRVKKLPPCNKFLDVSLDDENKKFWEEAQEYQHEYANVRRKADLGLKITRDDVKKLYLEAFDVAQVIFNFLYLLQNQYGKHYRFTVDEIIQQGIEKNRARGYYDEKKA